MLRLGRGRGEKGGRETERERERERERKRERERERDIVYQELTCILASVASVVGISLDSLV